MAKGMMKGVSRNLYFVIGGLLTGFFILFALVGQVWQPYDPLAIDLVNRFSDPSAAHLLGTDSFGRDTFSRLISGAGKSLALGFGATALSLAIGLPIALAVGYFGGWFDMIAMRIVDVLLSIPSLIFALIVVVALGSSHTNAILALGLAAAPKFVRVIRSAVLDAGAEDYVTAAKARGERALYIQYREILPNIWPPIIVEGSINVGFALMSGAALSYLGLGTQPPAADWGVLVRDGQQAINQSAWPLMGPALTISLSIVGFNLFGEGLRDLIGGKGRVGDE